MKKFNYFSFFIFLGLFAQPAGGDESGTHEQHSIHNLLKQADLDSSQITGMPTCEFLVAPIKAFEGMKQPNAQCPKTNAAIQEIRNHVRLVLGDCRKVLENFRMYRKDHKVCANRTGQAWMDASFLFNDAYDKARERLSKPLSEATQATIKGESVEQKNVVCLNPSPEFLKEYLFKVASLSQKVLVCMKSNCSEVKCD